MMTMTSNENNILHDNTNNFVVVRDGEKFQECLLKKGNREHDYESINSQYVSKNVIEVEYICLECNDIKYVYNYIEDSEL